MNLQAHLRSDVHAVAVHDDIVLLDIGSDSYHCLPGAASALDIGRDGSVQFRTPGAAELFRSAGLLAPSPGKWVRLPSPPRLPTRGLDDDGPAPQARATSAAVLALAVLDLARWYRGRSFALILDYARRGAGRGEIAETPELLDCVRRFHVSAIWSPVPRKCFARSFVLLRVLRRSGYDARWVVGVRTWPFAAHCWLQVGDLVLDDHPERLTVYTPICSV